MAENTYKRTNTIKEPKQEAPKANGKEAKNAPTEQAEKEPGKGFKISFAFLKDPRFIIAVGFFLMVSSFYLTVALISYFFTGEADQSVVEGWLSSSLQESGAEVNNWLGLFGAVLSHLLIFKWFGISSFLLMPYLFLIGFRTVFKKELFSSKNYIPVMFFFLVWTSTAFGYLSFSTNLEASIGFLGGGIGYELAFFFHNLIGWGTFLLVIFSLIVFVVYYFNITSVSWNQKEDTTNIDEVSTIDAEHNADDLLALDDDEEVLPEDELEDNLDNIELVSLADEEELEDLEENIVIPPHVEPEKKEEDNLLAAGAIGALTIGSAAAAKAKSPNLGGISFEINDAMEEVEKNAPAFDFEIPDEAEIDEKFPTDVPLEDISEDALFGAELLKSHGPYDPTLDLGDYQYPGLDLLKDYPVGKAMVTKEELEANKDKIVETLSHYGIGIDRISATIGPTVTLYEIVPAPGVRISKIKNLEDDIALSLAALGIRIIAPMPGKGTIGIEVPNKNKEIVPGKMVVSHERFMNNDMDLPIVLGKTISNEVFVADLAKMPHLLIAGATGQGKSVGLNMILASLLFKKHPSQLKLVLVDPKKVELSIYSKIERHFLAKIPGEDAAIITETKKVVNTLNSVCIEMDRRYDLLKTAQCRNLKEYNLKFIERRLNPEKGHRFLPFIVVVIDELADLMMTAGKEVETPIARIAQLARAVGIHLVVATQRPSVNVITGIIKANFPARLSFRVTQKIDSRTILDAGGADQLIGKGDMLLKLDSEMTRIQCAFLDTPEVERVVDFIGNQRGYSSAYLLPEFYGDDEAGQDGSKGEISVNDLDPLFADAARLLVAHQQGSTSLIQRRMSLGYNRAGRIIDQMEGMGVVGPFEGSKAREVLIKDEQSLEQLLRDKKII